MPAALEGIDWQAAQDALAAGLRMEDVAERLSIPFETLRKRARRKGWLVTTAVLRKAQQLQKQGLTIPTQVNGLSQSCPIKPILSRNERENRGGVIQSRPDSDEKIGALMLQTLERNDDRASLLASGIAVKALEKASKRKKPIELDTIAEVDKALMVTKRAAGKDRDETGVTVNLFSPQAGTRPAEAARGFRVRVQEAETLPIAQEGT